jgi:hypothetical protein
VGHDDDCHVLFVVALTLASAWDRSIYLQGLQDALMLDL